MKAIAYYKKNLPIEHPEALIDIELPDPQAKAHDLLVDVKAVSVNPVDVKVRQRMVPFPDQANVLGWDVAGVVRAVGQHVSLFKPGDRVWYAGTIARPGANSEQHLVDERIVGHMPKSLSFAEAAALPLTSITAWELLFDRLQIPRKINNNIDNHQDHVENSDSPSLLIIGAAGGVGSILTQLARHLTHLRIIGTASRPETQAWVKELGAHHVIDHSQSITEELKRIHFSNVNYVIGLNQTDKHFKDIVEIIAPQGRLALIDDPELFDFRELKRKSVSLHWELMFTRSIYNTADQIKQHELLNEVAQLIDEGILKTTLNEHFGKINATNLRRAHTLVGSNRAQGKIVLEGF